MKKALSLLALFSTIIFIFSSCSKPGPIVEEVKAPTEAYWIVCEEFNEKDGETEVTYIEGMDSKGNYYAKFQDSEKLYMLQENGKYLIYSNKDGEWQEPNLDSIFSSVKKENINLFREYYFFEGLNTYDSVKELEKLQFLGRECTKYEAVQKVQKTGANFTTEYVYEIIIDNATGYSVSFIKTKEINPSGTTEHYYGFKCTKFETPSYDFSVFIE